MAREPKHGDREIGVPKPEQGPPKLENSFGNQMKLAANANSPRRRDPK